MDGNKCGFRLWGQVEDLCEFEGEGLVVQEGISGVVGVPVARTSG